MSRPACAPLAPADPGLAALVLAALALGAMGGCAEPEAAGPPELHLGVDECSFCRMIISEERYAGVARSPEGEALRFDDVGCMVRHFRERAGALEAPGWRAWVWVDHEEGGTSHEEGGTYHGEGGTWQPVEEAWFVRIPGLITPMASGLAPAAGARQARELAAERGGEVLRWPQLPGEVQSRR